jgi:hypothetical protein
MDRTRVRDGLVCDNYVFFDSAQFQELVRKPDGARRWVTLLS